MPTQPDDQAMDRDMMRAEVESALGEIEYYLHEIEDDLKYAHRYLEKLAK